MKYSILVSVFSVCFSDAASEKKEIIDILPEKTLFLLHFDDMRKKTEEYISTPEGMDDIFGGIENIKKANNVKKIFVERGEKPPDFVTIPDDKYFSIMAKFFKDILLLLDSAGISLVEIEGDLFCVAWFKIADIENFKNSMKGEKEKLYLSELLKLKTFNGYLLKYVEAFENLNTVVECEKGFAFKRHGDRVFVFANRKECETFFKLLNSEDFKNFRQNEYFKKIGEYDENFIYLMASELLSHPKAEAFMPYVNIMLDFINGMMKEWDNKIFSILNAKDFYAMTGEKSCGEYIFKNIKGGDLYIKKSAYKNLDYLDELAKIAGNVNFSITPNDGSVVCLNAREYNVFSCNFERETMPKSFPRNSNSSISFDVKLENSSTEELKNITENITATINSFYEQSEEYLAFKEEYSALFKTFESDMKLMVNYKVSDCEMSKNENSQEDSNAIILVFNMHEKAYAFAENLKILYKKFGFSVKNSEDEQADYSYWIGVDSKYLLFSQNKFAFNEVSKFLKGPSEEISEKFKKVRKMLSQESFEKSFPFGGGKSAEDKTPPREAFYEKGRTNFKLEFSWKMEINPRLFTEKIIKDNILILRRPAISRMKVKLEVINNFPEETKKTEDSK